MSEGPPPIPDELIRCEAERISARYRVSMEEALSALKEAFGAAPKLASRVCQRHAREDVSRWREFRDVVRRCREELYYGLRRYYSASGEAERLVAEFERETAGSADLRRIEGLRAGLLEAHKSTRERMPHYAEFYEHFFELLGVPSRLLDLACGMHPLSYPFAGQGAGTELYVAFDKDERASQAVRAYARVVGQHRLVGVRGTFADVGWMDSLPAPGRWDVALMLKVVPVLNRLDRRAAARLAEVPARRILLTGSIQAMTRRQSIEARERRVLKAFMARSGRRVVGEFRVGDEFGYLLD